MRVVIAIGEYNVGYCTYDETDEVIQILSEAVINPRDSANKRDREYRKLTMYVREAMKSYRIVAVSRNNGIIGCATLEDRRMNTISYIHVYNSISDPTASGVLNHYIVNDLFQGEDVYMYSSTKDFSNVADEVTPHVFKFKDSAKLVLNKLYGQE